MLGEDFCYNGSWLSNFGMKMFDPEKDYEFIGRECDRSDITAMRDVSNYYSTHYSDVLTLSFLAIKYDESYDNQAEMRMTGDEVNEVRSWLESSKRPAELLVLGMTDDDTYYYGLFTDVQPYLIGQECYGLYATFTCNAPYGYSPVVKKSVRPTGASCSMTYYNNSSEQNSFLFPAVTIYASSSFTGDETVSITNDNDGGRTMTLSLPEGASELTINCAGKFITKDNGVLVPMSDVGVSLSDMIQSDFISADSCIFNWLRLVYGKNKLSIVLEGGASISKIEVAAQHPVKSGGF